VFQPVTPVFRKGGTPISVANCIFPPRFVSGSTLALQAWGPPAKKHADPKKKKNYILNQRAFFPLSLPSSHTTSLIQPEMPAATTLNNRRGGRKAGAQNFSVGDKEFLVTLLDKIHPLGQEQWDEVVTRYNAEYAEPSERNTRD
jgi:hypothetical protein